MEECATEERSRNRAYIAILDGEGHPIKGVKLVAQVKDILKAVNLPEGTPGF